jgi:two-component system, chemotaxis family, sensor kinase CheA
MAEPPALLAKFRAIAQERLAKIDAGYAALEQTALGGASAADGSVEKLMREIHTLKGEARMMGLLDVSELAHRLEDLLGWARDRQFRVPDHAGDTVYLGLDVILPAKGTPASAAGFSTRSPPSCAGRHRPPPRRPRPPPKPRPLRRRPRRRGSDGGWATSSASPAPPSAS